MRKKLQTYGKITSNRDGISQQGIQDLQEVKWNKEVYALPRISQEPYTYLETFCRDWAQHSIETFIESGMQMLWMFPFPSVKYNWQTFFGKTLSGKCI